MMMFGFIQFLIVPLLLMIQGTGDPLDHLDSALFWQERGVAMETGTMVRLAKPPTAADAKTLETLAGQLGAPGFKERREAERQLLAAGPEAIPFLVPLQKSEDPEVATLAAEIMQVVQGREHGGWLDRLMAIRALGELKAESSLPLLGELEKSPDPAIREYAARATAALQGKPAPRPVPPPGLTAAMLRAFPASAVTACLRPLGETAETLPVLLDKYPPGMLGTSPAEAQKEFIKIIERLGPFRLDQVIARANLPGNEKSFSIGVVLAGRFDLQHITQSLESFEHGPRVDREEIGGVSCLHLKEMGTIALIGPGLILFQSNENIFEGGSPDTESILRSIRALQPGQAPPPGDPDPVLETLEKHPAVLLADLSACPELTHEMDGLNRVKVLVGSRGGKLGVDSDLVFGDEQTAARIVQNVHEGLTMVLTQLKSMDGDLHKSIVTWLKAEGFKASGKTMEIRLEDIPPSDILRMFIASMVGFRKVQAVEMQEAVLVEADEAEPEEQERAVQRREKSPKPVKKAPEPGVVVPEPLPPGQ